MYTPGLSLISTVPEMGKVCGPVPNKSCNNEEILFSIIQLMGTSEAFEEGARHNQILMPEKSSLLQHFAHIVSS